MGDELPDPDMEVTMEELGELSDHELLRLEERLTVLQEMVDDCWDEVCDSVGQNAENAVVVGVSDSIESVSDALVAVATEVERRGLYEEAE